MMQNKRARENDSADKKHEVRYCLSDIGLRFYKMP